MSRRETQHDDGRAGRRPRRLAWALACAGFLSIVVGGMLTGYGAGGVASDGPGGVHHFAFVYPTGDWLGVWDIFLEHAHRFVGTVAVLMGTVLVLMLWRMDAGKGPRRAAMVVAGGLWLECVLGGLSVLSGRAEPTTIAGISTPLFLTRLHAWIAPAVFAAAAVLVEQMAGKRPLAGASGRSMGGRMRWLTWIVAGGIYLQIVLGGQLRYVAIDAAPWWFTLGVWLHLAATGIVACGVAWLLIGIRRLGDCPRIAARVQLVGILFALQIVLGVCAWVTSYGWPLWFTEYVMAWEHNIVAEGVLQVAATTAHVAVASLCLAAAVSLGVGAKQLTTNN
jgi:heme a synthase